MPVAMTMMLSISRAHHQSPPVGGPSAFSGCRSKPGAGFLSRLPEEQGDFPVPAPWASRKFPSHMSISQTSASGDAAPSACRSLLHPPGELGSSFHTVHMLPFSIFTAPPRQGQFFISSTPCPWRSPNQNSLHSPSICSTHCLPPLPPDPGRLRFHLTHQWITHAPPGT